jgi:uncharacterized membrane protein YdjX (TVP38/TMEM64 family)
MQVRKSEIIRSIIALFIFVLLFSIIWWNYGELIWKIMTNKEALIDFIEREREKKAIIFILLQALQIVFFVLPGEITQIAGGYLFGTTYGSLYSFIGSVLGTTIAFFIAKISGEPLIKIFISEEKYTKLKDTLNHNQGLFSLFMLFLIPGLPKDLLSYIAGISPINPIIFITISTIARIPGIILSSYSGDMLAKENYIIVGIVIIISSLLLIISYKHKDKFVFSKKDDEK